MNMKEISYKSNKLAFLISESDFPFLPLSGMGGNGIMSSLVVLFWFEKLFAEAEDPTLLLNETALGTTDPSEKTKRI